jgi:hypothetical protein
MTKPYSLDLRERVTERVAAGDSVRAVATIFTVSVASGVRWSQRLRRTGSAAGGKMGPSGLHSHGRTGLAHGADRGRARGDRAWAHDGTPKGKFLHAASAMAIRIKCSSAERGAVNVAPPKPGATSRGPIQQGPRLATSPFVQTGSAPSLNPPSCPTSRHILVFERDEDQHAEHRHKNAEGAWHGIQIPGLPHAEPFATNRHEAALKEQEPER